MKQNYIKAVEAAHKKIGEAILLNDFPTLFSKTEFINHVKSAETKQLVTYKSVKIGNIYYKLAFDTPAYDRYSKWLNDKYNLVVPSLPIKNDFDIFYIIYQKLSSEYDNYPEKESITLDQFIKLKMYIISSQVISNK